VNPTVCCGLRGEDADYKLNGRDSSKLSRLFALLARRVSQLGPQASDKIRLPGGDLTQSLPNPVRSLTSSPQVREKPCITPRPCNFLPTRVRRGMPAINVNDLLQLSNPITGYINVCKKGAG